MEVSAEAARRCLVARQLLAPARSLEDGRDGVLEVFRRFGSIQFDPIDVAGRAHDLMLHARADGYDPAWCDELYERREIFEAYDKGLSLVVASEFPWFRAQVLRQELVENGDLVPVEVEGVRGQRFVLRDEVELLEAPPEPPPSVAFLPPFDPLVWDRGLLGSLFEFDYVWELFHPSAKRRWGWYVLPILFRDRFIGRIEPRIDRAAGLPWTHTYIRFAGVGSAVAPRPGTTPLGPAPLAVTGPTQVESSPRPLATPCGSIYYAPLCIVL